MNDWPRVRGWNRLRRIDAFDGMEHFGRMNNFRVSTRN